MKISEKFLLKNIHNEYMLIPLYEQGLDMSKVFNLNEIGYLIYNSIKDGLNIEEIATKITSEYKITYEEAYEDSLAFIEQLKKREIIYD